MNALSLLRVWRRQVQDDLLPDLHGHQSKALADLSFAMTIADHCWAGKLAVAVPGDAKPASVQRRVERTLANDRLDPQSVWPQLARAILGQRAGASVVLILDETPNHNDSRCMKITLAYRKRAPPIGRVCYAPGGQPEPMPEPILGLFHQVAACLPEGAEVTLLADRGPARPRIVDARGELGWHFVIRLQGQTKVRATEGTECPAAELAPKPGAQWRGQAEVFKKSGWRTARVAACREKDQDGPWLLVSDRPEGARPFRRYATRVWTEELFRDEKGQGFPWELSHVTDPTHAARRVLLIAPATYLMLALGSRVIQSGLRGWLESTRQRMLSLFTIGMRWMMFCLTHDRSLPNNLSPLPS